MPRSSEARIDRTVPSWAAMLLGQLAQDRPTVLTRDDLDTYLADGHMERDRDRVIRDLVRLDWLVGTRLKGVWAFLPPGETTTGDPYIDLRAWRAKDPLARFALAGEAAAFHLGYLDRRFDGPISIWLPDDKRPPLGLRDLVSVVGIRFRTGAQLEPSWRLLRSRGLDVNAWSSGLPAFGPEALLVQLAARPASFGPWADLVAHLDRFVGDCHPDRIAELLEGQTASSWQRAAYLLDTGSNEPAAAALMERRPTARLVHVTLGDGDRGAHSARYGIVDRLVAPLLDVVGKA